MRYSISLINNKDGYITANELKKGIQSLNSRSDSEIEEIMNSIDTDKNGAINYNEFIAATLNDRVASDYQRIIKAFEFFDINKDGMIDENELKNSLAGKEFEKIDINIFYGCTSWMWFKWRWKDQSWRVYERNGV